MVTYAKSEANADVGEFEQRVLSYLYIYFQGKIEINCSHFQGIISITFFLVNVDQILTFSK